MKPAIFMNNRPMRLAIASRMLGVPQSYFGIDCQESLVDDALELSRFRGSATCVYVLGALGLKVIKVGWSGNPFGRIKDITTWMPVNCVVVGLREARCPSAEKNVHLALKEWHQRGEWFRLTTGTRDALRRMLAIEIEECVAEMIGVADG